jgi:hypothetical protein
MKWRTLLPVLTCILLPLPVVALILMSVWRPTPPVALDTKTALIPMLDVGVRRALGTYERSCTEDAECDAPLVCLRIESELRSECTDSRCMEDKDCPEGFACLPLKTRNGKALVRRCSLIGNRKEAEKCEPLALSLHLGCERGLLCQAGWCGRPCRLDDPSSCSTGFFCSEGHEGPPSCLPTCEGRTCPEGQQCLAVSGGASLCRQMQGPDCRRTPCPEGHTCKLLSPPQRPWELRTECRRDCDFKTPCPEGFACYHFECRQKCDPRGPSTCGPGQICGQRSPTNPWYYCLPG